MPTHVEKTSKEALFLLDYVFTASTAQRFPCAQCGSTTAMKTVCLNMRGVCVSVCGCLRVHARHVRACSCRPLCLCSSVLCDGVVPAAWRAAALPQSCDTESHHKMWVQMEISKEFGIRTVLSTGSGSAASHVTNRKKTPFPHSSPTAKRKRFEGTATVQGLRPQTNTVAT